jgi:hypothetical protein
MYMASSPEPVGCAVDRRSYVTIFEPSGGSVVGCDPLRHVRQLREVAPVRFNRPHLTPVQSLPLVFG